MVVVFVPSLTVSGVPGEDTTAFAVTVKYVHEDDEPQIDGSVLEDGEETTMLPLLLPVANVPLKFASETVR